MGTTCSNCNCNRDERDNELKIDEKAGASGGGNSTLAASHSVSNGAYKQITGAENNLVDYVSIGHI